jgi:hypothetical protein
MQLSAAAGVIAPVLQKRVGPKQAPLRGALGLPPSLLRPSTSHPGVCLRQASSRRQRIAPNVSAPQTPQIPASISVKIDNDADPACTVVVICCPHRTGLLPAFSSAFRDLCEWNACCLEPSLSSHPSPSQRKARPMGKVEQSPSPSSSLCKSSALAAPPHSPAGIPS